MKIVDGKLIFEEVTCWNCNGKKEVRSYHLCPLQNKPVITYPGHKCPHCGTKNRNNHQITGSSIVTCPTCEGKGTEMENEYSHLTQETWNAMVPYFKFTVVRSDRYSTFNENYFGIGYLFGCMDYGRVASMTDDEILKLVPTSGYPSQPIADLVKKSDPSVLPKELVIIIRNDGYSVWPVWPKA